MDHIFNWIECRTGGSHRVVEFNQNLHKEKKRTEKKRRKRNKIKRISIVNWFAFVVVDDIVIFNCVLR